MPRFVEGEVLSLPNAMTAIKAMKRMKLMKAMKAVKAMQTNKLGATRAEFNRAARDLGWDPAEVRQYLATWAVDAMIELRANESMEKPMETNKSGAMTAAGAYAAVAENMGLNPKDVKAAVEGLLGYGAKFIKKHCRVFGRAGFVVAGMLKLRLAVPEGRAPREGVNPSTKKPCVFKGHRWKFTVRAVATKKFNSMVDN